MPTNVLMPQMGESITEGTVIRWIKGIGDPVDRDEPLFEISTDKVDAEIPSPAAGILTEIRVKEGETVAVDTVVAVIGATGEIAEAPAPASQEHASSARTTTSGVAAKGERQRQESSPLVRKLAREHGVEIGDIAGTGAGGRVTKHDILQYVGQRASEVAPAAASGGAPGADDPIFKPGETVKTVPMTVMRRKIAEHMVVSRRTAAHAHTVFDVDFTSVSAIREARKTDYEREGARLTYLVFIAKAVVDALHAFPVVNASIDGDNIVYRKDVNLGIAVALERGLIVPVVKRAGEKSLLELARAIADLAGRARSKQLKPEEVQGGTFTVTNAGLFGALLGLPIINHPQVAILGVGAVEKRPVVLDAAVVVRPRAYLTLGYDHRLIDGAVADEFMSVVKQKIEGFERESAWAGAFEP